MPMEEGQQVQDVLYDEQALTALNRLAELNPNISDVIANLGRRILDLPDVGVREQTGEEQRTYDLAFVRPRTPRIRHSRRKAFVGFITPTHHGEWTPSRQNSLGVGIRINPSVMINDPHGFLQERAFREQGGGGWHDVYVNGLYSDAAFDFVEQAYHSFD